MGEPAPIALEGVSHYFGKGALRRQILFDVSAEIDEGEIVILTGPSGSGKTTALTLIGALRRAQEGSVRVLGEQLRGARTQTLVRVRRRIGYIFQQHNLLDALTAEQNVGMGLHGSGFPDPAARIREVLAQVGLEEHLHKHPDALSGGQQQRVAIARALVHRPRVLLADEPTASLDKEAGRAVVDLIRALARGEGTSVVLVTHDNRILDVADRILHLEDGRLRPLSGAVASNTSRMLQLLERHDPEGYRTIAAYAVALARVAHADREVSEEERETMRRVLAQVGGLEGAEVSLVVELAMAQIQLRSASVGGAGPLFTGDERNRLLNALRAVAEADGQLSEEEDAEIARIVSELDDSVTPGGPLFRQPRS